MNYEDKIKIIENAPEEMQLKIAKAFIREDINPDNIQYLFNKDSIEKMNEDSSIENENAEKPEGIGTDGFVMRTSKPSGNLNYITRSSGGWNTCIKGYPTDPDANVLSNCVGYASGRYNEIINRARDTEGCTYTDFCCNASGFANVAKRYGLKVDSVPRLGAIGVMGGGYEGAGHVFIVERVDSNNQIYTSESAYSGSAFYNKLRTNDNGRWGMSEGYWFIGFVYLPDDVQKTIENKPEPEPTPTPTDFKIGDRVLVTGYATEDCYGCGSRTADYGGNPNDPDDIRYITLIEPNTNRPYHISVGNTLGDGDRGWVSADQISKI